MSDCGEIIMGGNPYCPHCGSHLIWDFNNDCGHNSSFGSKLSQISMSSGQRSFLNGELTDSHQKIA